LFFNCDLKFNHRAFFVNLNDTYNVGNYVIKVTWWLNKLITLHWISGIIRNNKCIFTKLNAVFNTQNGCMNKKILQRLIPSQIPDRFSKLLCSTVKICVASYFMYGGVSHEGKYCTKFLNQYNFICSKFYKLYKYNINISHYKTTGLRNSFNNLNLKKNNG
jgi:hypothetical protein